jgi:septal ring-binding cell division protein DamX
MTVVRSSLLALAALLVGGVLASAQTPAAQPTTAPGSTAAPTSQAPTAPGVVRAVLFYSENCPHCSDLRFSVLPPIQQIFGANLDVLQLKVNDEYGDILYQMALELYVPKDEPSGVPMMVIDSKALIGLTTISDDFPLLVETYLSQGGVDWPDIPGLRESIAASEGAAAPGAPSAPPATDTEAPTDTPQPTPVPSATPTPLPTATPVPPLAQRVLGGRVGQSLALLGVLVVLAALLAAASALRGRRT